MDSESKAAGEKKLMAFELMTYRSNDEDQLYRTQDQSAVGNCGMRKVKCGIENAEWRWLVEATNHETAVIPQITSKQASKQVYFAEL